MPGTVNDWHAAERTDVNVPPSDEDAQGYAVLAQDLPDVINNFTGKIFTSSIPSVLALSTEATELVEEGIDDGTVVNAIFDDGMLSSLSLLFTFIMIIMCIVGAINNILSLIIFTSPSFRKRSINILLAGLSASDLVLLILAIPVFSLSQIQKYIPAFSIKMTARLLVYAYPVTLMAQTMSVWMLVNITIDRYLAVCHPFAVRIYCTTTRALTTIACIVIFSVGYNFVRFWEYTINLADNVPDEEVIVGRLRQDYWFMVLYQNIATLITQFVLPLVVLCVLNLQVARTILRAGETRRELVASEKREHSTAKMMLFVVIVFLFCYTLSFCLNVMEMVNPNLFSTPVGFLLNDINNILVVFNSSSSFIFYTKYSSRYRAQLRTMYGIRYIVARCCFISGRNTLNGKPRVDEYTTLSGFSTRQTLYCANPTSKSQKSVTFEGKY